ncbi:type II toxin-antitoxin system RelE/ParE family toxin [Bordetella sp. N]|uniref:type II toxin-antitoxin system RelE/ParE family toxin n=1 Tax=Bordetella sp. N TaxID=1746199 RepID=UPI00070AA158|nr:type II toxin-antitoxin system RelE/ParE family toxin [Bordetella sp. N]ALM83013.1 transcriptional regulator [Bordetella sp. N]
MLTVIETAEFVATASKIWSDVERDEFVEWIASHPEAGDVIPGSGGCRKVRWARGGMGKQGGARVIYFLRLTSGEIVLVVAYAKAKYDNISTALLAKMKEKFDAQKS